MKKDVILNEESKKRVDGFVQQNGILYSFNEVAAILNRTRATLLRYVKTGKLEGCKIGGRWCFTKKQIEDFMKPSNKEEK